MSTKLFYEFKKLDKKVIDELKEELDLIERDYGEMLILRSKDKSIRIDVTPVRGKNLDLAYNIMVTLLNDQLRNVIAKYFGEPTSERSIKPNIIEFCEGVLKSDAHNMDDLISNLMGMFNLNDSEVRSYFNRIMELRDKKSTHQIVNKAAIKMDSLNIG